MTVLDWVFFALKDDIILVENITLSRTASLHYAPVTKCCKHNVVTDDIITLRTSNQVLCNMWSYNFYDMTLATE